MEEKSSAESLTQEEGGAQEKGAARILFAWTFFERPEHERDWKWYVIASIICILLFIWAIFSEAFLFGLILVLSVVTFVYAQNKPQRRIEAYVDELGISIDGRYFTYREFSEFWLAYNPPYEMDLYLTFSNRIRPRLVLPLPEDMDVLALREHLRLFVIENLEREGGSLGEYMRRRLKL